VPRTQRLGDLLVRPIETARVVLFDHPRTHLAGPERDQDRVRASLQGHRRAGVATLPEPEPLELQSGRSRIPARPRSVLPSGRRAEERDEEGGSCGAKDRIDR
jgi:hypothetical protein